MTDHYDVGEVAGEVACPSCGVSGGQVCRGERVHPQRYIAAMQEIQRRRDRIRADLARLDSDLEGRIVLPNRTPRNRLRVWG